MSKKSVQPAIQETAFDCPHCGAYTTQTWFDLYADSIGDNRRTPLIPNEETRKRIQNDKDFDVETKTRFTAWVDRISTGLVSLEKLSDSKYLSLEVENAHLSKCYNCKKIAVWVHENMVFPGQRDADMPNPDMEESIIHDFEEARGIVSASPRGAAALLRLCVQKLCKQLGEKGRNIDDDIASLVQKGLSPIVQKSLDVVRVIGNEAVHPGAIDLKDDRETAMQLFKLVNLIAEQMISVPKSIGSIYDSLPEAKRKAIERRDGGQK